MGLHQYFQDLWGISADINNNFGLLPTHSFTKYNQEKQALLKLMSVAKYRSLQRLANLQAKRCRTLSSKGCPMAGQKRL